MSGRLTGWLLRWLLASLTALVCLGQELPSFPQNANPASPPLPGAARITGVHGEVNVLKGSYPWALSVGDMILPKQVILTGADSFAVCELEDGSSFTVFPNSRVTFRANAGDWRDLLDLWLGRVKIHIQKLGGQPNRNRVFTPTAVISVRGTVFDVVIEDEADTTLVVVDEGAVDVRHRLIGESKSKLLQQGESIRVFRNEPLARSAVDKNALAARVLRAAGEALYTVLAQGRASTGGGGTPPSSGGGGPSLPGDTGGGENPAPQAPGGGSSPTSPPVPPAPPPPGG